MIPGEGTPYRQLRKPFMSRTVVSRALLAFASSFAFFLLGASAAQADGTPDLQLTGGPAGSVLYGNQVPVDLTASIPAGQPKGYNLAFRAVLPDGTSYVPGSAGSLDGEPQILHNAPATGKTTLIWENVDDLVPRSSHTLSFKVAYNDTSSSSTPIYDVGDPIPIDSGAYISTEPRDETDFDGSGNPVGPGSGTYTGKAEQSTITQLTAIKVDKSEPHPEGEIPRGLHDHQTVYTLKVTNNKVNPTTGVSLEDYIPAGLEFLGCANTPDHTTDAPTNPGSTNEYKGSGPIDVSHPTAAEDCVQPDLVETVDVDPDGSGPLPAGVYTHVKWNDIGDFAPDGTRTITYGAAIPIRENTMDWNGAASGDGTAPATDGTQTANLDNNSGPETYDEQPLLNGAIVAGTYEAPSKLGKDVSDEGTLLRTAEDIAIQKSRDIGTLEQGDITKWTLNMQTSEYRTVDDVVVHDVLPNGLCPLGSKNYENPVDQKAECDPVTGKDPSPDYTSVAEQPDGTYDISWDASTVPALAHFDPSSTYQLTFYSRTRDNYQSNFVDTTPILSKDSVSNAVDTSGLDYVINGSDGNKIDHDETDGVADIDVSSAGKAASGPVLEKTVAAHLPASGDCNDLADAAYGKTVPVYGPGDQVCWKLRLVFPQKLDTTSQDVFDILPNGIDYVPGSDQVTANDTVPVGAIDTSTAGRLRWPIGTADDVDSGGQVFEVTFKSTVGSPSGHSSGDVEGNLMKFSYENTAGIAFPLRDRTDFALKVPPIKLTKGVRQINGTGSVFGPNTDNKQIIGGDSVQYRVDVTNPGEDPLTGIRVWDKLPTGITCADVDGSSISDSGACDTADNTVKWSGLGLSAGPGTSKTLTYTVDYPTGLSPDQNFINRAGVVEYTYTTNDGQPYQLIPDNPNVKDSSLPDANVPKAEDASNVRTVASSVVKTRTTSITDTGNNAASQATIGETIDYTVTTTIPKDTTLYGTPTVVDALGSRQTLVPGSLCATACTFDGQPVSSAGITVAESPANTVTATFPSTYANTSGHDQKLVLHFSVRVNDVAANAGGGTLPNSAKLTYKDQQDRTVNKSGSVNTSLVEPKLTIDKSSSPSSYVEGGDTVTYTLKVKNTGSAPAYDADVTDEPDATLGNVTNGSLPPGVHATKTWSAGDHTMSWHIDGPIDPGATVTITYTADMPAASALTAGDTIDNTAAVGHYHGVPQSDYDGGGYRDYTGPSDSVHLTVAKPDLSIAKTPDNGHAVAGQASSFTVKVTNTDPHATAHNVKVHDVLDAGLHYSAGSATASPSSGFSETGASGQTIDWKIATLGPGASVTITVPVTVDASVASGTHLVNTASTHADEVPTDKTDIGSLNVTTQADLKVDKSTDHDPVVPGTNIVYTIVTHNNGPSDARAAKMTDTLPGYLTFVSLDDSTHCATSGQDITCNYGTLAPGATRTVKVTAKLDPSRTTPISNGADVDSTTPDTNPSNNHSDAPNNVKPTADVSITKTSDHGQYDGGDIVTYTLKAHNDGPSTASGVTVDDDLPTTDLTFVSVAPTPACAQSAGHVHCNFGSLVPGANATAVVKMKAKGNPPAPDSGETHKITVSKQEQYLSLQAGETKTVDVACPGGIAADGAVQVVDVESGKGTPEGVEVRQASSIAKDTYRFTIHNGTSGQAQVRPHVTCLPQRTDDSEHPLEVGGLQTKDTGTLAPGRYEFTIPVDDQHHAIAQGIEVLSGSARLVGSEPTSGGWKFTVDVTDAARVRLSLRTLLNTTGLGGTPQHVHAFSFKHVERTVTIQPGRTNQIRVGCPTGYEGIVGTYDLPPGVVSLGSVPEPINRDFDLWNGNDHAVQVTLDLECISIETGPPLDELLPIVNTATVATTAFDPDHSNDSDSATIHVARAAGSVGGGGGGGGTPLVAGSSARVSSSGSTAKVKLSCSGAGSCAGTAKLTAIVHKSHLRRAAATAAGKGGKRKVVLGRSRYAIDAGSTAKVKVKIAKRYRQLLRKRKVKRVTLSAGETKTRVKVVVHKRKHHHKRHHRHGKHRRH